jgi:hypothetical protein
MNLALNIAAAFAQHAGDGASAGADITSAS